MMYLWIRLSEGFPTYFPPLSKRGLTQILTIVAHGVWCIVEDSWGQRYLGTSSILSSYQSPLGGHSQTQACYNSFKTSPCVLLAHLLGTCGTRGLHDHPGDSFYLFLLMDPLFFWFPVFLLFLYFGKSIYSSSYLLLIIDTLCYLEW